MGGGGGDYKCGTIGVSDENVKKMRGGAEIRQNGRTATK